jgi:site-specific DNA recombinase
MSARGLPSACAAGARGSGGGGLLPWTRAPYGYRTDPDRPRDPAGVRLEPAEAAVVAELFARYREEGVSLVRLALELSTRGTPTPRGHWRWNQTTLRGLLSNPTYIGQGYVGRTRARPARVRRSATHSLGHPTSGHAGTPPQEWVPVATIPAVVSREQFDRGQAKLARNQGPASQHRSRLSLARPGELRGVPARL